MRDAIPSSAAKLESAGLALLALSRVGKREIIAAKRYIAEMNSAAATVAALTDDETEFSRTDTEEHARADLELLRSIRPTINIDAQLAEARERSRKIIDAAMQTPSQAKN